MKFKQLSVLCPKCGSKDKCFSRKLFDKKNSDAKMESIRCDGCGHIFE